MKLSVRVPAPRAPCARACTGVSTELARERPRVNGEERAAGARRRVCPLPRCSACAILACAALNATRDASASDALTVATELIKTLQQITSSLVVQQEGRSSAPAALDGASSKEPNNVASAPARAPISDPATAPAAAFGGASAAPPAVQAPPAPAPKAEITTAASIIEGFARPQSREAALNAARVRLQAGGEAFWGELFAELQNVMFIPEPERRPASSEPFIEAMLALPEPYVELLRKRLTPVLLKKLTTKRAPTVPREEVQVRVHA